MNNPLISLSISISSGMTRTPSFHRMYTPQSRQFSGKFGSSSPLGYVQRMSLATGSENQFSAADALDSLTYFYDNSMGLELPPTASLVAKRINWESAACWKLLIEIYKMEAIGERIRDQIGDDEENPLRDGFISYPAFRRLMALIRWVHWVNTQEAEDMGEQVSASRLAYPNTSVDHELPIDTSIRTPEKLNHADLAQEHQLCRQVWQLLTQGRLMDAIELCTVTGHHWRAGVLNAASGHLCMAEDEGDDSGDHVEMDWVESVIVSGLFGVESGLQKEAGQARQLVKKTANEILSKNDAGVSEFDTAITGYLCGNEEVMRRVAPQQSFSVHLFVSLHALKEEFVSFLLGNRGNRFDNMSTAKEVDSLLADSVAVIVSSLDTALGLDELNQFKLLQSDLAVGDYESALNQLHNWVSEGTIRFNSQDFQISLPGLDETAAVVMRSFASCLATVLRDIVGRNIVFDESIVSAIVTSQVEALVAQLKGNGSLAEGNDMVVETLALLTNEPIKIKTWAWYIRQYMHERTDWTGDRSLAFPPMISLAEMFPGGALSVFKLLTRDIVERRAHSILSHAIGTSVDAGRDIEFAIGCLTSFWMVAQSAAKSTGNGVFSDLMPGYDDPDEAASNLATSVGAMISEALSLLILSDLQAAKHAVALTCLTVSVPGSHVKLLSVHAAVDSVLAAAQEQGSDHSDPLSTVSSFIQILDRVTSVMERNSLLEQQRANLAKLSGKTSRTATPVTASADTRRQLMESHRLIDSATQMIGKLIDDIIGLLNEYLSNSDCPIDLRGPCALGTDSELWRKIATTLIDVVLESSVQAIALVDDRQKQVNMLKSVQSCQWVRETLSKARVNEILEEIA